jgi:hypothetical protein
MVKRLTLVLISAILVLGLAAQALAQIKGRVYADYYFVGSHHDESIDGQHGFWFRRLYFTYDHKFTDSWKARVRFEAASKSFEKADIVPFVKDLYIQYSKEGHSLLIGISGPPTFAEIEEIWGYRAVEKTPLDLYKMRSSRDTGFALIGDIADKKVHYHFMVANGEGKSSEYNKDKTVYAAIGFRPIKDFYFEFYGDYAAAPVGKHDSYTMQGFLGYQAEAFTFGAHYSYQNYSLDLNGLTDEYEVSLVSAFANFKMHDRAKFLVRLDRMIDPLPFGSKVSYSPFDNTSPFYWVLAGIDIQVIKGFNFIPNITYVSYDDLDTNDFYGRFTFYWKW